MERFSKAISSDMAVIILKPCLHQATAKVKATSLQNGFDYFLFGVYTKQLAILLLHSTK